MSSIFHIREHIIDAAHVREYHRATSQSQDQILRLHVKQYIPKDNPNPKKGDVTIIGGHANGFPKELYEPLWEELYHEAKARNVNIRSIWIADTAWQGQSGRLNRDALGNDPGWLDYARDIVHMINTFRPPTPIMGVGHSFGANALTNVSLLHSRLLTSLILLDPVISRYASSPEVRFAGAPASSISRRDVWPSRKDAEAAFRRNRFYQSWDPRVLDRWVSYGIVDVPGQEAVTLSTTKHQELFNFLRPTWDAYDSDGTSIIHPELVPDLNPNPDHQYPTYPFYRPEGANTLARLPNVRPGVLYVFGGKSDISPAHLQEEKMTLTGSGLGGSGGAKAGRVRKVVGDEYGHLIPMENPRFCAQAAAEWIQAELERWWVEERKYEAWTKAPAEEKTTLSNRWYSSLGKPKPENNKAKI
ncbi:Alpha/beta hydrolase family-domain-containing protein [Mariannaea sp. PMI_226]|nr:Alpha/beta hydrolase family-domain-containing protein [Mariannaea sp. PMI_226]